MNSMNSIMSDAFKALENIDDELVETSKKKVASRDRRIKESRKATRPVMEAKKDLYIYQFPPLTRKQREMLKEYDLEFLGKQGKGGFQPGDYIVRGTLENLRRYCGEYLDYDMHPDYLCKEGDFCKDFLESCDINESPEAELDTKFDNRKSFYGKAVVDTRNDGTKVLYSYGCPVCRIENGKVTLLNRGYRGWATSATTLRHVKEFLRQNGFKADSLRDMEKSYPIEQARADESLTEAVASLSNKEEVEAAKEIMDNKDAREEETIVDVDAETIDQLKDSYVGNAVLRCPVCRCLIYKKPSELKMDEDKGVYNEEEECPHCHTKEGFELVGQIAEMSPGDKVDVEEKETTGKESDLEPDTETIEAKGDTSKDTEGSSEAKPADGKTETTKEPKRTTRIGTDESLSREFMLEDIDEGRFDKLVNQYLVSTYSNVGGYETTGGKVDNEGNTIVLEGTIKYKSGKERPTAFTFEARSSTKNGRIRFVGVNETFTKARNAFSLYGRVSSNGCLRCESLHYSYGVRVLDESKTVRGKAEIREKKSK